MPACCTFLTTHVQSIIDRLILGILRSKVEFPGAASIAQANLRLLSMFRFTTYTHPPVFTFSEPTSKKTPHPGHPPKFKPSASNTSTRAHRRSHQNHHGAARRRNASHRRGSGPGPDPLPRKQEAQSRPPPTRRIARRRRRRHPDGLETGLDSRKHHEICICHRDHRRRWPRITHPLRPPSPRSQATQRRRFLRARQNHPRRRWRRYRPHDPIVVVIIIARIGSRPSTNPRRRPPHRQALRAADRRSSHNNRQQTHVCITPLVETPFLTLSPYPDARG